MSTALLEMPRVVLLTADDAKKLLAALEDVINRYEAADEHDGEHYETLRSLAESLE